MIGFGFFIRISLNKLYLNLLINVRLMNTMDLIKMLKYNFINVFLYFMYQVYDFIIFYRWNLFYNFISNSIEEYSKIIYENQ